MCGGNVKFEMFDNIKADPKESAFSIFSSFFRGLRNDFAMSGNNHPYFGVLKCYGKVC
ncbi:hypothetical protein SPPR111872_02750 [Sphingobacterium prati]